MTLYKDPLISYEDQCYKLLLERLQAITFSYDIQSDVMVFNRAVGEGGTQRIEEYRKKLCTVNRGEVHPDFVDKLLAAYMGQNSSVQEFLLDPSVEPQGRYSWYEAAVQPVLDEQGRVIRTMGILWNIENRKGQMETSFARFRSDRDPITGILNQHGMEKDAGAYLASQGYEENSVLMLVYLTNFARIVESRGKRWSDHLLIVLCKSIGRLFRASDILGHLGGGRFAVFVKDVDKPEIIDIKARALRELFTNPDSEYGMYGLKCRVSTAFYLKEGRNYLELFALARDKIGDAEK